MKKVNLEEKFNLFSECWSPKVVAELNDNYVKLAKFKGAFAWHTHHNEDEMFLVVKGAIKIKLRDRDIQLGEGEFFIVPKGVEHMPVADEEAHVLLLEPKTVLNTGDKITDQTVTELDRI